MKFSVHPGVGAVFRWGALTRAYAPGYVECGLWPRQRAKDVTAGGNIYVAEVPKIIDSPDSRTTLGIMPATAQPEVELKDAVQIALQQFTTILPHLANNLSLEEIETSEDGRHWLVTLGYDDQSKLLRAIALEPPRGYKIFKIEKTSGKFVSMKIRSLR